MGIKKSVVITAEVIGVKASRLQAVSACCMAERLLQDEQVRPVKPKKGKQGVAGRVRVERSSRWDEAETLAVYGSWGYVQPGEVVTAHRDFFTLGVVDGSGAMSEATDLPVYQFRYVDDGRNYRVVRDFGLGLARRWARRYAKSIAMAQGAMAWVDEKHDVFIMVWEDDQQAIDFGHIRSKDQLRELIRK